jgi:2-methylcitrate dehydratase PrpD
MRRRPGIVTISKQTSAELATIPDAVHRFALHRIRETAPKSMTSNELPKTAVAEHLAQKICALDASRLPDAVRRKCEDLLLDVVGLAVTARNEDYVRSALAGCDDDGPCTAIGHARALTAAGAALVNGTAIHGEDFDDTFEGGPVHAGAVVVPAVLAACERYSLDGRAALVGIAAGIECMCRLSLVAPTLTHKAGFHPTAVFGAMGAAAGVGAALKLTPQQLVDALGTVGSMAGGIIEYLAEGAWTKRLHAGWAAQSGLRAALLGRAGFLGPRTVFEGVHGFFHGFAHTTKGDYDALIGDFGQKWVTETLAFKPYPCGTMTHPYIDCARRLAGRGIKADDVVEMICEVGEGTVHRLWEPLAAKQRPANGYAGKFSTPYCIAAGFMRGNVGLGDFSDTAVRDGAVLALAAKVRYAIDPQNPYPKNFTGHIRATLRDGSVMEERQPYMRGGTKEPLTRTDIEEKFLLNAAHGGWSADRAAAALKLIGTLFGGPVKLSAWRG